MSVDGLTRDIITGVLRTPKYATWEPQPDITTYELALAMPVLLKMTTSLYVGDYVEGLPAEVQRHFRVWWLEKRDAT